MTSRPLAVLALCVLALPFSAGALPPPALPLTQAVPRTEPAKPSPAAATEPTFAEYDKALAVIKAFNESLKKRNLPPLDDVGVGRQGKPGLSAYEIAKKHGFAGTEVEWLASLRGPAGPQGPPGRDANPKPIDPPVDPAPIPFDGNRVLIVYESATTLPAAQSSVIFGAEVRKFLDAKCVLGQDGKTRDWRIFDRDVDASGDAPIWSDAMKRPRKEVPWVIISTGRTGFEGPLPKSVPEMMALLKKYFGE